MGDQEMSRIRMVNNQLRTNDVTDHRVLDAMAEVPRERFVPAAKRPIAYSDQDLLISGNGTERYLMKPHVFGKLAQLAEIRPQDVVLVVGCGTGYSVAVLARIAESVVGIDVDPQMVESASEIIVDLGIDNAAVIERPLTEGCSAEGPFDVILVDGAIEVPPTKLLEQLKDGGRLVVVEGTGSSGTAMLYIRSGDSVSGRFAFNASARLLPGFERPKAFVF